MKKKLVALLIAGVMVAAPVTVYADSLAHLESKDGIIDVVSYVVESDVLHIICEYQNTTDESTTPLFQFVVTAFQDGIEMEKSYDSYKEDGCKASSTEIRPGATLKYATSYELDGNSPVELEVTPIFNFDDLIAEYTINLDEDAPASEEPDYETMYNELKKQFDELQSKYDELVKASEQK